MRRATAAPGRSARPSCTAKRSTAALTAVPASCASVGCASSAPGPGPIPRVLRLTVRLAPPGALDETGPCFPEDDGAASTAAPYPAASRPASTRSIRRGVSGIVQAGPAGLAAPLAGPQAVLALGPSRQSRRACFALVARAVLKHSVGESVREQATLTGPTTKESPFDCSHRMPTPPLERA